MRHPLLLQGALAALPEPPSAASEDTELSYLDSFAPRADVPSQAPSQAPADAGGHRVSQIQLLSSASGLPMRCCRSHLRPFQMTPVPGDDSMTRYSRHLIGCCQVAGAATRRLKPQDFRQPFHHPRLSSYKFGVAVFAEGLIPPCQSASAGEVLRTPALHMRLFSQGLSERAALSHISYLKSRANVNSQSSSIWF